jgi:hypothetical protein
MTDLELENRHRAISEMAIKIRFHDMDLGEFRLVALIAVRGTW